MQKMKKILLAVSIITMLSAQTVSAQENMVEENKMKGQGSIQVVLSDEELSAKKEGVEFQCVKVADIINGEYLFYEELPIGLKNVTKENLTAKEQDQIVHVLAEKKYASDIRQTDNNGEILFDDLDVGLYLLKAKDSKTYGTISPSLVAIPTWDETEKEMEYHVKVIPKYTKEVLQNSQSVKTGDFEDVTDYAIMVWISLICIMGICVLRRRKFYGRK